MEKHIIQFGKREIQYELQRKNVKNINLNVKPNLDVVVSAGSEVPLEFIENYVKDKAPWIIKNLDAFKETLSEDVPRRYVSGETVKFLGKQYLLRVIEDTPEDVVCKDGFIDLTISDRNKTKKKEKMLSQWLREQAELAFQKSLDTVYPKLQKYGIAKPGIMIRSMKARWGSCLRDRRLLLLNFELVKAPTHCIDYVVLHELLHFMCPRHDSKFFDFMTVLMPDWVQRKEILDEEVVRGL